jgi:hypothetical protein
MRETRLSGSEGGAGQANAPSLPLYALRAEGRTAYGGGRDSSPAGIAGVEAGRPRPDLA